MIDSWPCDIHNDGIALPNLIAASNRTLAAWRMAWHDFEHVIATPNQPKDIEMIGWDFGKNLPELFNNKTFRQLFKLWLVNLPPP